MSPEPFVSHAKALPAKRNEKGYGDENEVTVFQRNETISSPGPAQHLVRWRNSAIHRLPFVYAHSPHAQKIGPGQRLSALGADQKNSGLWGRDRAKLGKPYFKLSSCIWVIALKHCGRRSSYIKLPLPKIPMARLSSEYMVHFFKSILLNELSQNSYIDEVHALGHLQAKVFTSLVS